MNKFFACALLLLFPAAVFSFEVDGNRWPEGETTFHVDFTGLSPSGTSWNQSFEDALAQWNEKTSFNFLISDTYADPCEGYGQNIETGSDFVFPDGEGDSRNGADFYDTVCGNEFGSNVLAITLILSSSGLLGFSHITQTDILYKNAINWDVYRGNTRPAVDFGRVSLHELGHVLGLGHESEQPAIMAPSISNIDSLQNDDINGVNAIYGGPSTDCSIALVTLDTVINGTLGEGDCRVLDLYNGGSDTSFVDGYKLILDDATGLTISMESSDLDSVVLLTDARLHGLEFNDDFNGTCNARISGTFPAGEYLILANTYDTPGKCAGNTGAYRLTITDNSLPLLSNVRDFENHSSRAIISGGASSDGGSFAGSFPASEPLNIQARILVDPDHIGKPAAVYVMAVLDDGRRFVKTSTGRFMPFSDGIAELPFYLLSLGIPQRLEFSVIENFIPRSIGLSGTGVSVFVGYALSENPANIHFNGDPIRVNID